MVRSNLLVCIALCVASIGFAKDAVKDETVEGTVKAVVQAEEKVPSKAKDAKTEKQHEHVEEAAAVAKATREVLKTEGKTVGTDEAVPHKIRFQEKTLDRAEETGEKTFKELSDVGINTKAAAAAAAEAEVASADGAVGEVLSKDGAPDASLSKKVKQDAEKAGIAAGKAVADHPHDEGKAMADAVEEVEKEETSGKADLKKDSGKGLVAEAEGAVTTGGIRGSGALAILAVPLIAVAFIGWKSHKDKNTPYLKRLQMIREEFDAGVSTSAVEPLEAQYTDMQELSPV